MRHVLGIATFALLYQMFSVGLCRPSADASTNNVSVGQNAKMTSASAATLQYQLETILKAAKRSDSKQFDDLIDGLQIPDGANWFTTTFGEEIGEQLAATYSDSWNDYKRDVSDMYRDNGTREHTRVFVEEFSASSLVRHDAFIRSILQNAKGPVVLYTAGAGKYRKSDVLPGVYIYAQGSFRVVNWRTFYDLPNAEPMRIQADRRIVAQPIQHIDRVTPSDAHQTQLHDTVMVRVVIDRDGVIALAEPVSGPPELFNSAVNGIRLFRFKPETRYGAPVEIETTLQFTHLDLDIKP